jgi:hypothetical protein
MADQSVNLRAGLHNVGSYQVSGIPFASASVTVPDSGSSPLQISFPFISKEVVVRNIGGQTVRLGFSLNGVSGSGANYVPLAYGESFSAGVRVTDIYLVSNTSGSSTVDIFATLTGIGREALPTNWSGSTGVG